MDKKPVEKEIRNVEKNKEILKKAPKQEEAAEKNLVEDYLADLKRVQADFENYVKRTNKEKEQIMLYAKESLLLKLFDIIDNFERALHSMNKATIEQVKQGVEMIFKQIQKIIVDEGVNSINSVGENFDPEKHEAIMFEDHDTENIVLEEFQKGYSFNGRIIRPAKVKVSKKKSEVKNE